MSLMQILTVTIVILVFAIIILAFVYWQMSAKEKQEKNNKDEKTSSTATTIKKSGASTYTKLSVFDFMEFDKIEDNMIIQDNGKRYLMGIECEGINYDLMSEVEKTGVEQGFIQFLNTLRHPIQIYTQTRTVNIGRSIENYNRKINEIKGNLVAKRDQYNKMLQEGGYDKRDLDEIRLEIARQQNLYDYGADIVANIESMSLNKNVLRKHYYIIIPFHVGDLVGEYSDEEEKRSMIFSELYTRASSIANSLFACSLKCRVMDSNDLAELLYVAYNRDESETYGIEKAINSGYGELYSTSQDVLDKKMRAIDRSIEEKAMDLAKQKVNEIKTEKEKMIDKKEKSFDELVAELATLIVKENKDYVGKDVAKEAVKRIRTESKKNSNTKEEEVEANVKEEKTTKVRRTRKNA